MNRGSAMISVVIPVYNVEPYLRKCLDSIINQTYRNLEILIIDDGSTDESGRICDEYGKDERVIVFHTCNRGLSRARNMGLDYAKGDWIGFVDADDWIELDMYESLLKRAEETGADIVECGFFREFSNRTLEEKRDNSILSPDAAVRKLLFLELSDCVWNKIWNRKLFCNISFPEGRSFEDDAVTYKIFFAANRICTISESKYHYVQRKESLANNHNIENLVGYWLSHKERYDALHRQVDEEVNKVLLRFCAVAVSRTWTYYYDTSPKDRLAYYDVIREMNIFTKQHIPILGKRGWGITLRVGVLFPHYLNRLSFGLAWLINRATGMLKNRLDL